MFFWIDYILKLSAGLGVVYLFYRVVLRKLTFYSWNRWYLLAYTILCFIIPLLNVSPLLTQNNISGNNIVYVIPALGNITSSASENIQQSGSDSFFTRLPFLSMLILLAGVLLLLIRFGIQMFSYQRMLRNATLVTDGDVKIYHVNQPIIPFSFGNSVFINKELHTAEELEEIIRHEFVHVKQRHTIDILWAELLCIINWFNPFAWLIRKALRQNLEFIADDKVLGNGIDKKQYQYLLLKVIGNNQYSIVSQFNFSSLKKRIAMMNKIQSARMHLVKFLFILPLMTVTIVAFRKGHNEISSQKIAGYVMDAATYSKIGDVSVTVLETEKSVQADKEGYYEIDITSLSGKMQYLDLVFAKEGYETYTGKVDLKVTNDESKGFIQIAPLKKIGDSYQTTVFFSKVAGDNEPSIKTASDLYQEALGILNSRDTVPPPPYFQLPENVRTINISKNRAVVKLSNGQTKTYNLDNQKEKIEFEEKYGSVLQPPPVPPAPPVLPVPPVLPENVETIEIVNKIASVKLRDGKTEKYNLENKKEKAEFEKKYGLMPTPPSPPAPPIQNNRETPSLPPVPSVPPTQDKPGIPASDF